MIIDVDAGNTRCKWRVVDKEKVVRKSGNSTLEQFLSLIHISEPTRPY